MGFRLYQEVIDQSQAAGSAYQVHINLAVRANDVARQCRASVARIAKETRLSMRGTKYGLQALRDHGHITSSRKGSAKGINLFTLLPAEGAAGALSQTDSREKQSAAGAPSQGDKVQPVHLVEQTKCNPCTQSNKKEKQLTQTRDLSASQTSESLNAPIGSSGGVVVSQQGEPENQDVTNADQVSKESTGDKKILVADFSEKRKRTPPNPPLTEICHFPKGFEFLWKTYPRGGSYARAVEAWNDLKLSRDELIGILQFLKTASVSIEWTNEDGRYIPSLVTFLQRKAWLDKLTPPHKRKMKFVE